MDSLVALRGLLSSPRRRFSIAAAALLLLLAFLVVPYYRSQDIAVVPIHHEFTEPIEAPEIPEVPVEAPAEIPVEVPVEVPADPSPDDPSQPQTLRVINDPYPDYDSVQWTSTSKGPYQPCMGPHGRLLSRKDEDMMISGYHWNISDFETPVFGSYEALDLDRSLCSDRHSRYSAYGYTEGNETSRASEIDWEHVNWAQLQQECLQRNAARYSTTEPNQKSIWALYKSLDPELQQTPSSNSSSEHSEKPREATQPQAEPRTAVILRSWIGMQYTEPDLFNIRSMIMELSLYSGGEYEVILLIDCQDQALPEENDEAAWTTFKDNLLPPELRGMAVFFNDDILWEWYPEIDVHAAMFQYFQPTQIFSQLHPQYDYIWQFEMDARYTGHMYDLVHKATEFAKQQPRKYLWERNSYFYIPAVHGTWEEFSKKVDQEMAGHESIWGPHPAEGIDIGGKALPPPVPHPEEEPGIWGVGEEADFISWLPHFDPTDTFWPFRDKVFNFPQDQETPRRAAVVAMSRISARLLGFLHHDKKHSGVGLVSEMSPVSWAMYYGLKAVHIPHPIYHESKWDPQEINRRANPGEPGKVNAGVDSIWSWDMHNDIIDYLTFMFNNKYSERFFRKWMGLDGAEEWEKENGRRCVPPIFMHPVKDLEP